MLDQKIKTSLIGLSCFASLIILLHLRSYFITGNYEFDGAVEKISYSSNKGTPKVIIKGQEYILSYNDWNVDREIEQGDSLIKRKGEMSLKLIKKETREVIIFNK